eukprot:Clim_evm27s128 gene=Clim_evmTU27s128
MKLVDDLQTKFRNQHSQGLFADFVTPVDDFLGDSPYLLAISLLQRGLAVRDNSKTLLGWYKDPELAVLQDIVYQYERKGIALAELTQMLIDGHENLRPGILRNIERENGKVNGSERTISDASQACTYHIAKLGKELSALGVQTDLKAPGDVFNMSMEECLDKIVQESPNLAADLLANLRRIVDSGAVQFYVDFCRQRGLTDPKLADVDIFQSELSYTPDEFRTDLSKALSSDLDQTSKAMADVDYGGATAVHHDDNDSIDWGDFNVDAQEQANIEVSIVESTGHYAATNAILAKYKFDDGSRERYLNHCYELRSFLLTLLHQITQADMITSVMISEMPAHLKPWLKPSALREVMALIATAVDRLQDPATQQRLRLLESEAVWGSIREQLEDLGSAVLRSHRRREEGVLTRNRARDQLDHLAEDLKHLDMLLDRFRSRLQMMLCDKCKVVEVRIVA